MRGLGSLMLVELIYSEVKGVGEVDERPVLVLKSSRPL